MRVHLVNPSEVSFGTAVITPRWLYVLAAATPATFGDPSLVDETLETMDAARIEPGDIVGIGIHTANALRGYKIGTEARARGAYVVFGGIHATLYPNEAHELGGAHAVVKGDGDVVWAKVLSDCAEGIPQPVYEGGRIEASEFLPARWDLVPRKSYMWASVQTVRGCPKHCSFCSVWRTDGQRGTGGCRLARGRPRASGIVPRRGAVNARQSDRAARRDGEWRAAAFLLGQERAAHRYLSRKRPRPLDVAAIR